MFARAYSIASQFTLPVITSARFRDGTIDCGIGAFIVINEEGWIVTVAHLFELEQVCLRQAKEIKDYDQKLHEIQNNPRLDRRSKRRAESRMRPNPKWITNRSYWWGSDEACIKDVRVLEQADLAIGRLEPFGSDAISEYPVIKRPYDLPSGTSLCKLGFPFHSIEASFEESTEKFKLSPDALPVPRFPLEGIFTRNVIHGKSPDGKYDLKWLETSAPGLRGQSGGPIFDTRGTVWAIQSRTQHFPLGFSPKVVRNGKEVEENQFLNVGWGIHAETLVAFLTENGVRFQLSDY